MDEYEEVEVIKKEHGENARAYVEGMIRRMKQQGNSEGEKWWKEVLRLMK